MRQGSQSGLCYSGPRAQEGYVGKTFRGENDCSGAPSPRLEAELCCKAEVTALSQK